MAITNRDLPAGTKLVARYKGQQHTVLVLGGGETGKGYELDGGTIYTSLSAAGGAVMGGISCNGWRFWSLVGEAEKTVATLPAKAAAAPKSTSSPTLRQIKRVPNQKGVPEGQTRWYCSACQKGFFAEATTQPEACPEGHAREVDDEFGTTD
jgi:hypothetical protein